MTALPQINEQARAGILLGQAERRCDEAIEGFVDAIVDYAREYATGDECPEAQLGRADFEMENAITLNRRIQVLRAELAEIGHR